MVCLLQREDYLDYCKRFKRVERYLMSKSASPDIVAYNICKLREYYPERMSRVLIDAGFMYIEEDSSVYEPLINGTEDLGLFSNGTFLLANRFIFPVRDMLGNTIALIGWFPDDKKYITTPSRLFSKSCLYYGMERVGEVGIGKNFFLVEGIFDRLSIQSLGLNAISQMGISSSRFKESMYPLFKSLVGIPDNDSQGRSVVSENKWSLPTSSRYFTWSGDSAKDIDLLINSYEKEDIRELLWGLFKRDEYVVNEKF